MPVHNNTSNYGVYNHSRTPSPNRLTRDGEGNNPVNRYAVADGKIGVTTFTPSVDNMHPNFDSRLNEFKQAVRMAQHDDVVMAPEYYFNRQRNKGMEPCSQNQRNELLQKLCTESAGIGNQNKTILVGMVWEDAAGQCFNTVDAMRNGSHIDAHHKKTTDQYDAIHYPSVGGWHQGDSDHGEFTMHGNNIWLTTCSDNKESYLANKNLSVNQKPDLVLVPASGLGMPMSTGKPQSQSVVADADGYSKMYSVPAAQAGYTANNIIDRLANEGQIQRFNAIGIRRDDAQQEYLADAIANMIHTGQASLHEFDALRTGMFGGVMNKVDSKLNG